MYYVIHTTKTIGGTCEDVPVLSLESKKAAFDKLNELVKESRAMLDQEMMRFVGGNMEYVLESNKSVTGLFPERILRHVVIKRPLHSPKAMVYIDGQFQE